MWKLLRRHKTSVFPPGQGPETGWSSRVIDGVEHAEFWFISPGMLIGTASNAWSDILGAADIFIEWSATGKAGGPWLRHQFRDSPETEIPLAGGGYIYRALSLHPPATHPSQFARLGIHRSPRHRNFQ